MKTPGVRRIVGQFAQVPRPDPRQIVVADTLYIPRSQRSSGNKKWPPGHQCRQPVQSALIHAHQESYAAGEGPIKAEPNAVQQSGGENMGCFQSHKLVSRPFLCPENPSACGSPIPPIIKGISTE